MRGRASTLLAMAAAVVVLASCGGGAPTEPSTVSGNAKGLVLSNIFMQGGPCACTTPTTRYLLVGGVQPALGESSQLVITLWEVTIYNADGTVLLTWTDPKKEGPVYLGFGGALGGPVDPVPGRPPAATFRLRVLYTGGGSGVAQVSGPIIPD
jgi:hypothetical protein